MDCRKQGGTTYSTKKTCQRQLEVIRVLGHTTHGEAGELREQPCCPASLRSAASPGASLCSRALLRHAAQGWGPAGSVSTQHPSLAKAESNRLRRNQLTGDGHAVVLGVADEQLPFQFIQPNSHGA